MPPANLVLTHSHTAAALAAAPLRLPHAVVTHGNIFDRPWGTFDPLITILYRWVEPRACRRADFVIALAPSMVQAALDNGARPENVVLIPNGIDVDAYAEAPPQITSDEPLRLLFIGRLGVEKGVDLLLDACAIAKLRGVLVHLDVVGGGPLADDLRRQADRIRLDDVVTFHGQQPHEALRRFRAAAMAICVPSRSEAHPLVVLEALASGRPILGTTAGGIPWVVNDGVNGVIVEPEANALAAGIERMHRHRAELRAMAGRARASVERFAWDAVGEQLRAVVGERLNGK
jgi:glycosyltransferase involved in cell wall biosynthesis